MLRRKRALDFLQPARAVPILVSLAVVVPVGFHSKFYRGPAAEWVNNSLCGVFYEIFWCLVSCLFFPAARPGWIAGTVFVLTCALEFLQLWHPAFLEFFRSFFIGRTILGTSFTWIDFPYYLAGCTIGWFWMRLLSRNRGA